MHLIPACLDTFQMREETYGNGAKYIKQFSNTKDFETRCRQGCLIDAKCVAYSVTKIIIFKTKRRCHHYYEPPNEFHFHFFTTYFGKVACDKGKKNNFF